VPARSPQHVAPVLERQTPPVNDATTLRGLTRIVTTVRDYLPRGNTLDEEAFKTRHRFLCWILGLHLPSLFVFGVFRGFGIGHSALEIVTPAVLLLFGWLAANRRVAAFFVTAGLVFCSSVLVHLSGGMIEAHFHFFILIGLIALYQDWVPFVWNVVFTVLSHGVGTVVAVDIMFDHPSGQNRPWTWALIHGIAVLAACVGEIVFWRHTELQQEKNTKLAADLAMVQSEVEQRQSVSELFVNLARRNQSLLDRQLELIGDLEQRERNPDGLSELFQLDHLATRIRRNAESLLVLSGDDPPRRWGRPVPLSEVVRAAAAEVEDFRRVEVLVNEHLEVAGRAVADLAHLLAELIENATTFSPPSSDVRVRSHLAPAQGATFVLSIEDTGIGMPLDELDAANQLLAEPPEVDLRRSSMLGFHVVGRLAKRYGIDVRLANTPGGGMTALVTMPDDLVSERRTRVPAGSSGRSPDPSSGRSPSIGDADIGDIGDEVEGADGWRSSVPDGLGLRPSQVVGASSVAPHVAAAIALGGHRVEGRLDWPGAVRVTRPSDRGAGAPMSERLGDAAGSGHRVNGWHQPPSGPVALPAPVIGPAADGMPAPPVPPPPPPPGPPGPPGSPGGEPRPADLPTINGLARRVPGAGLTPSLRRRSGPEPTPPQPARGDRERVRSMLSRFQQNQQAGRAAAHSQDQQQPPEEERQ
jgi:signal transduction histidine kinase